ncbi:MAG TPA: hypothetical protein VND98_00870 [Solirubrobacterales bacterium]|nr:hypothetical protein [Solirubrobacterales bacterium]
MSESSPRLHRFDGRAQVYLLHIRDAIPSERLDESALNVGKELKPGEAFEYTFTSATTGATAVWLTPEG